MRERFVIIDNKKNKKATNNYKEKVKMLNKFVKKYGRLPQKKESLGVWCCTQKYKYKKGLLSSEQEKLLFKSGLLESGDYNFGVRVKSVNDFYLRYGRLPHKYDRLGVNPVGVWWINIKSQTLGGLLNENMRTWFCNQYPDLFFYASNKDIVRFMEWILIIKEYQSLNGFRIPKNRDCYMNKRIGDWCCRQKRKAINGELSVDKVRLLAEIGLIIDVDKDMG